MHISPVILAPLVLAAACGAGPQAPEPVPQPPIAANALVGTHVDLGPLRWLEPTAALDLGAHRVTLLRWWTVQCPFCRDSLPDLAALRARYGEQFGLVGVFHPKSPRPPSDRELVDYARALGFDGAIASDDRWQVLDLLRARGALNAATSISVLVDASGTVLWVHPGPRLHHSADPAFAAADHAFRQLEGVLADRLR